MSAHLQPDFLAQTDDPNPAAGLQQREPLRQHAHNQTPTLVGHGSEFAGQLHCPGDLTIAGRGEGVAHVGGTFVLSPNASWRGEIYCAHAVLAGHFTGRLHCPGKLEVHASAHLQGDLHAGDMAIAPGAVVAAAIFMADRTASADCASRK